jgi:hypothetical protein
MTDNMFVFEQVNEVMCFAGWLLLADETAGQRGDERKGEGIKYGDGDRRERLTDVLFSPVG